MLLPKERRPPSSFKEGRGVLLLKEEESSLSLEREPFLFLRRGDLHLLSLKREDLPSLPLKKEEEALLQEAKILLPRSRRPPSSSFKEGWGSFFLKRRRPHFLLRRGSPSSS